MGKYQRKSNRGSYSKEVLKEAVQKVESGSMSCYKASKIYQIPRMTIMDHVKKRRVQSTTLGRNTALSPETEYNLATSLHLMEKYGFGLSRKEVLQMVGDYINQNELTTPFKNGIPGKDWFLAFKKRHGLSIKKPQAVEYARKRAVDPFIIYPYFELLEKTMTGLNLKFKPSSIWNLDETSFSKDPAKTKIVGVKGHAATRVISTAGRDNTTVLLGASASGEKTPPLIVFKGKNVWDTWTSSEAYPGTSYAATKNGWMEAEVFESFFKKTFLPVVQNQRPVLLIYDGHSTHVGLNLIEEAQKQNITILKLPPHTSHILQPLDLAVMKPFKDRWDALLVKWQRLNVGRVMPKSEFAKLIGNIWAEIDPQILRNGFKKAGIYPLDRQVIKGHQFDALKLRHWEEYERTRNVAEHGETIRNPKTLLTLVLNFFNGIQIHDNLEEIINYYEPLENPKQDRKISFEELLLDKVKCGDSSPKPRRRKVAPGAEVITHIDVLEKKKEEQRKNSKEYKNKNLTKSKDTQAQASAKVPDDAVTRNDVLEKKREEQRKKSKGYKNKNVIKSKDTQSQASPKVPDDVITRNDVLEKKIEEQRKSAKISNNKSPTKDEDAQPQSSPIITGDVVYLKNISKNNCILQPFIAKDKTDLPPCLQRQDASKIKIISNILIKPPNTEETVFNTKNNKYYKTVQQAIVEKENKCLNSNIQLHEEPKTVKKQKDNNRKNARDKVLNTRIQQHKHVKPSNTQNSKDSRNLYVNTKPGPSGLCKGRFRRRSTSTTSVSGSISSYSDSDVMDIGSDTTTLIDDDKEKNSNNLPQIFDLEKKYSTNDITPDVDHDNEENQATIYYPEDNVLVRYHTGQKWTYYVGRIENIKIVDEELIYTIRFYKTIKKPKLTFKMTKKIDRDDVPAILIVKKVNLNQNPVTLNYFFVGSDENSIYF